MSSTTSRIFAHTVSGHRIIKIESYSSTKSPFPNGAGKRLLSGPFTVGGHIWRIAYYPNGLDLDTRRPRSTPCISLYLVLDERVPSKLVRARFRFRFVPPADLERRHRPACFPAKKKKTSGPEAHFDSGEVSFASHGIHGCEEFVKKKELEKSVYLRDDAFAIRCDITVFNGFGGAAAPWSVSILPPDLGRNLGDLLGAKKGADVKVKVGGKTFAAHRCLLAARSPVFAAGLFGSMREGRRDGGGVIRIRVPDMDARVFEALLQFAYTDSWPEIMADEDECTMAQHLLVAADRYGMDRLKSICEYKLCRYVGLDTAANILALAELHHCQGLKGVCIDFLLSPGNLTAAMTGGDFEHLRRSCPVLVQDLIAATREISNTPSIPVY